MAESKQEELIRELTRLHQGHAEKKLWLLGFPAAGFHYRAEDLPEGFMAETRRMILLGKAWNRWSHQSCFFVEEASDPESSPPIAVKLTAYRSGGAYKLSDVDAPSLPIGTTLDITFGTTRSHILKATEITVVSCPEEGEIEGIVRRELDRLENLGS